MDFLWYKFLVATIKNQNTPWCEWKKTEAFWVGKANLKFWKQLHNWVLCSAGSEIMFCWWSVRHFWVIFNLCLMPRDLTRCWFCNCWVAGSSCGFYMWFVTCLLSAVAFFWCLAPCSLPRSFTLCITYWDSIIIVSLITWPRVLWVCRRWMVWKECFWNCRFMGLGFRDR